MARFELNEPVTGINGIRLVGSEGGAFDEVSGATITSRAVINAVRNVLSYHDLARYSLYRELPSAREQ